MADVLKFPTPTEREAQLQEEMLDRERAEELGRDADRIAFELECERIEQGLIYYGNRPGDDV